MYGFELIPNKQCTKIPNTKLFFSRQIAKILTKDEKDNEEGLSQPTDQPTNWGAQKNLPHLRTDRQQKQKKLNPNSPV